MFTIYTPTKSSQRLGLWPRDRVSGRAFTLVELLVVLFIVAIISAVVFASLISYKRRQSVMVSSAQIATALTDARSRSLAGINDSTHGIYFADDEIIIFEGAAYVTNDPENETVMLETGVRATTTLSGGGRTVVFVRLTGQTASGTVDVFSEGDFSVLRTITIHETGIVSYTE
ncbi:MAG: type II secretion system protein [Patescibacteria group bacterium]